MKLTTPALASLLSLAAQIGKADPTWPAATDEMEEIVFQLQGFKGRLFNDIITPCNNEAAGPGRVTASEWLRVAFHDMSTANRFTQTGGLDASIQFELDNGENTGPGHATTLRFYSNYLSSRSSMADLIAAGTYASVRSCGGPAIPLRLGRKDATAKGSMGVPQPQNSVQTFRQQFDRMGFSNTEMIQVTACGHTLGGVHSAEFPQIVPPGTGVNGQVAFDTSVATFDNKVVTEYVDGTTQNRLVVGPAVALNRHSDFKVFNSDQNATVNAMASPEAFRAVCQNVLQKMIDVVPGGVVLTEPITPYMVKPVDMQLTLASGNRLLLTGNIRIRTTELPASSIENIVLTWKDRSGGNSCGSVTSCSTTSTLQGVSSGFDDTFGFFPISVHIPASEGISSFTVKVNLKDGSSQTYDNNGNLYPMNDGIIFQKPQSCLLQGSGALTATALVRNDLADVPVSLGVSYLTPRNTANPVPALNEANIAMTKGDCSGSYTFYSATFTIPGGLSYNARISVTAGEGEDAVTDDFNHGGALGGTCATFSGSTTCSSVTSSSVVSSASSAPVSSSTLASSSAVISSSAPIASSVIPSSTTSATLLPTGPAKKPIVGGYAFAGCWTEAVGIRALSAAGFAYDGMTLETCMGNCTGFDYWGTEYGRECYCANSLHNSSQQAPAEDCSMLCSGDQTEYCGAGNRIELYSTTATRSTTATPTPTGALSRTPVVGAYSLVGCQTEATVGRALAGAMYADDSMTLESCATFCSDFTYFGVEYSRECFCGNALAAGSVAAPESDCSMICAGNPFQYCGAGNRLELYKLTSEVTEPLSSAALPGSSTAVPTPAPVGSTTSPATPTGTLSLTPTVSPFSFLGCYNEIPNGRALSGASYASGSDMTLDSCAAFCSDFKYFATQYAAECYCGNSLSSLSAEVSVSDCSMPCSGNPLQYCGAGNRLQLYQRDDVTVVTPSHPAQIGSWIFDGCRTEATGTRALSGAATASSTMTLEVCAEFCEGFAYFGAEYGGECYCGNGFAEGSVEVAEGECGMVCNGDAGSWCGAGNRLSVYRKGRD
ncbi:putative fungistatic metabolite [Podospora aff. communis PSN243]|uniref:Fungistatic metabolite n=1 Tax=Podospora aff. communis PSN243 TaxID=3040156 RepID=A0AAV9GWI0_9PEZI|nr:putative fungistatic metabolite [Podospora aff. communis PSN243]